MKLLFDQSIIVYESESLNKSSSYYLNLFNIDLNDLIENNFLYNVNIYLQDNKKVSIKIYIHEDILYNIVLNNSIIPCYNSLINILNIYKLKINIDSIKQLNNNDLTTWICGLDNKIHNHNNNYSYYNNIIKLSEKLFYNKSSNSFFTNNPLKNFKSFNGGCIIDTLGFKNKQELYTIIKKPSYQTNNVILKKYYNGFKINRFITSDKILLICPLKMQKNMKQKIKNVRSIILTNKNYNKLTLNDIKNTKVVICSYNFLNSLIPNEYNTKEEINNNLYSKINNFFNKPYKINPFIMYWESLIIFNYDHLFKSNNQITNRIYKLLQIIESITQWIFINNKPNEKEIEYIVMQLFKTDNTNFISNKLLKNILVNKNYNKIINKTHISEPIEFTMKEQIILNSNGFKSELEKNYPLLFGDIIIDFNFFTSIENINKHIMNKIHNKIIKYDKLLLKFENGETINYELSVLKKKINKIQSQSKYFDQLFNKKFECCPICITNVNNNSLAITKCGHVFCYYCILQSIIISKFNYINCPKCREKLKLNKIYAINNEEDNLSQHGIKIKTLINKLIKSDDKILVLSKWGVILKYLKELLKSNSIPSNKYLLLSYKQLDKLEKRYNCCIMLDSPPEKYKKDKIDYYCDSIIKYTLVGIDNNIVEL